MERMQDTQETSRIARCLHRHPPMTPRGFYAERRLLLAGIGVAFVVLAFAAFIASGWLPGLWDQPVERFVIDQRSDTLDTFFFEASRLGSTMVIFTVAAILIALTWTRCPAAALVLLVATLARPPIEFTLKLMVSRDRPALGRLVDGTGYSFPSGHVMAAVALWGLLPLVVGLWTRRSAVWWASVAVSGFVIVSIAASRVYLGVHWLTDVVAGLLLGSFYLLGVEAVLQRFHGRYGCGLGELPVIAGGVEPERE